MGLKFKPSCFITSTCFISLVVSCQARSQVRLPPSGNSQSRGSQSMAQQPGKGISERSGVHLLGVFIGTFPISYSVIFLLVVIPQIKSVNQKYGQPWIFAAPIRMTWGVVYWRPPILRGIILYRFPDKNGSFQHLWSHRTCKKSCLIFSSGWHDETCEIPRDLLLFCWLKKSSEPKCSGWEWISVDFHYIT